MSNTTGQGGRYAAPITMAVALFAISGLGYLFFLFFVRSILLPGELAAYGLLLATVTAATAAFFSPCSFVMLPGYLSLASSGEGGTPGARVWETTRGAAAAALGVGTVVVGLGLLGSLLGFAFASSLTVVGPEPSGLARALRLTIGAFVVAMGLAQITGAFDRLPLLGRASAWAARVDRGGEPRRPLAFLYSYGVAYMLIGVG